MSSPGTTPQLHPSEVLIQISSAYMLSTSVHAVAKLGIADLLADGPKTTKELANLTGTNEDFLYRVLRALASVGIFKEVSLRQFATTPIAEELRKDGPSGLRDVVIWISDPWHLEMYSLLPACLKSGKTAIEERYGEGQGVFELFERDQAEGEVFNAGMTSFSAAVMPAVLEAFDFSDIGTLVDVAGGHGFVLTSILKRNPKMKGILIDLPHVVKGAPPRIEEMGLTNRCEVMSGDFFKSVPSGGDAYIMKHIIHDWDDDRATAILKNCHAALEGKTKGRVILLEAVVPPGNDPHFSKIIDLEMFMLPGGRERTEAEFRTLFKNAGFELKQIVPTKSPLCVIEAERV
jgi:hypothetical protein